MIEVGSAVYTINTTMTSLNTLEPQIKSKIKYINNKNIKENVAYMVNNDEFPSLNDEIRENNKNIENKNEASQRLYMISQQDSKLEIKNYILRDENSNCTTNGVTTTVKDSKKYFNIIKINNKNGMNEYKYINDLFPFVSQVKISYPCSKYSVGAYK